MDQAVILSAVRTPIGKFMGGLPPLSAPELGAKVVAEVGAPRGHRARAGRRSHHGQRGASGPGTESGAPGRPARRPASSRRGDDHQQSLRLGTEGRGAGGASACTLGESEIVVAGGMESMSNCPYLLQGARTGYRIGNREILDSMIVDGLWDAYENFHMGMTAELVAEKYGISRAGAGPIRASTAIARPIARHQILLHQRADRARGNSAEEGRCRW